MPRESQREGHQARNKKNLQCHHREDLKVTGHSLLHQVPLWLLQRQGRKAGKSIQGDVRTGLDLLTLKYSQSSTLANNTTSKNPHTTGNCVWPFLFLFLAVKL